MTAQTASTMTADELLDQLPPYTPDRTCSPAREAVIRAAQAAGNCITEDGYDGEFDLVAGEAYGAAHAAGMQLIYMLPVLQLPAREAVHKVALAAADAFYATGAPTAAGRGKYIETAGQQANAAEVYNATAAACAGPDGFYEHYQKMAAAAAAAA